MFYLTVRKDTTYCTVFKVGAPIAGTSATVKIPETEGMRARAECSQKHHGRQKN
jgi:hypothetical protein